MDSFIPIYLVSPEFIEHNAYSLSSPGGFETCTCLTKLEGEGVIEGVILKVGVVLVEIVGVTEGLADGHPADTVKSVTV